MTLSAASFTRNNLKNFTFGELFNAYSEILSGGTELERKMNEAFEDNDPWVVFEYASDLGVIQIKLQLIQAEMKRRDEEDGPITEEERSEAENALFEALVKSLMG